MLTYESDDDTPRSMHARESSRLKHAIKVLLHPVSLPLATCVLLLGTLLGFGLLRAPGEKVPRAGALQTDVLGFCDPAVPFNTTSSLTRVAVPASDLLATEEYSPGPQAWMKSPYAGAPSDEKGLAWDQLQQGKCLHEYPPMWLFLS